MVMAWLVALLSESGATTTTSPRDFRTCSRTFMPLALMPSSYVIRIRLLSMFGSQSYEEKPANLRFHSTYESNTGLRRHSASRKRDKAKPWAKAFLPLAPLVVHPVWFTWSSRRVDERHAKASAGWLDQPLDAPACATLLVCTSRRW